MTVTATRGPAVHVPANGRPVKVWASEVEQGALDQADNLARLPFVISHVALMPDAHQGYGMPIGGVLFADRAVVPYAIGVDIGCGVILAETDLTVDEVTLNLDAIGAGILERVPVGNGPQAQHQQPQEWPDDLAAWPASIEPEWISKVQIQLGTLGGGNHFMELQADDDGRVYVMLHSGSRSLGKRICDHFHKIALALNQQWFSALPDKELAYLPFETAEAQAYWESMQYALRFAEWNRARMLERITDVLQATTALGSIEVIVDCHHNYAAWENHKGKNGIVHRKGAVRARAGEDVLIPGSMGTGSYWARGLGNAESFETCQHGAGRAMSRGVARRAISLEQMKATLNDAGTRVYAPDLNDVRDEAPGAYKPIEDVMAASADLVEVVKRLRPIATVKG